MTNLWRDVVEDRSDKTLFRVRRDAFSDPEIFEMEMSRLFEGGWVYLAHASQVPNRHDYVTTWIGRRPIVVMRDGKGELRAFHNACPHRGARLCNRDRGNAPVHVCPFHAWTFASDGSLRGIKDKDSGGYTDRFLAEEHDLAPIALFAEYRGFLFGSLNAEAGSLTDFLGDAARCMDLIIDQGNDGIEFVPGGASFIYEGNWKAQLENCSDAYHVTSVHPSYLDIVQRRDAEQRAHEAGVGGVWERSNSIISGTSAESVGGSFTFRNGHVLSWAGTPPADGHPLSDELDELVERVGEIKAKWMFYSRNLTIFPNLQLADGFASQLRVMRPLAPGKTEMTTYCMGPKGEAPDARRRRLRQYEDFFQPSGLATPDDLVIYEDCQTGHIGASDTWLQGYERGMAHVVHGANEYADELGVTPETSVAGAWSMCDETLLQGYYRAMGVRFGDQGKEATS